jgi:hypothetical protein
MNKIVEILKPTIEETIKKLNEKKFKPDPIGGEHFSRIVSLMSSAYKRHGFIIEKAILESLKQRQELIAWDTYNFHVSKVADHLVDEAINNPEKLVGATVPYSEPADRKLQIDTLVYSKKTKTLKCYEIKRGNGLHDAGKRRSILRDAMCAQVLLKSYGEQKELEVTGTASHVIFYYGACSLPKPFSLTASELNEHFNYDIQADIEEVNHYFKERLYQLISG